MERRVDEKTLTHQPVMLAEALDALAVRPDGRYVDGTFGRGGHSKAILRKLGSEGRLLALDCDLTAIAAGRADPDFGDDRLTLRHGSFAELKTFVEELGWLGKVDGILLDLGVSSPQLDDPQRGFSFRQEGPLDMRMNPSTTPDAGSWLNTASAVEIADVLKKYGDERHNRRIAQAIVYARAKQPLVSTTQLATVIASAVPRWERRKHPATRSFQAIRIFVNREIEQLGAALQQGYEALAIGGRLVLITFHSLEARAFKDFILAQTYQRLSSRLKRIGRAVKVSRMEAVHNRRARSALVRTAEKVIVTI